jgi:hypothetical protein
MRVLMQQPPLDELGVVPHDHDEIGPEDNLVRYLVAGVNTHQNEDGSWRVSSGAFSRSSPRHDPRSYVSVDLVRLLLAADIALPYLRPTPRHGVATISVGSPRALNLKVGWVPLPENPTHCGIWGELNSKSIRNKLAKAATLLVLPEN